MESPEEPGNDERRSGKVLAIITTVLIGCVAVGTAWTGYQASDWGGKATDLALRSNSYQSQSSEASLTANQLEILDIQIFIEWLNATAQGNTALANIYQQRMRDAAKPAFNAWLATDPFNNPNAPTSPFIMPQYVLQERVDSQTLKDQSTALYNQYQAASERGSEYVLITVVLASALFFAGLSTRIGWRQAEITLVIFAIILLAYGLYRVIILQIG